jgi:hypothetical protein
MKFQDVKDSLERMAKKLFSPKTVAVLGAAVALFQFVMAIEEMRSSLSEEEDDGDDGR